MYSATDPRAALNATASVRSDDPIAPLAAFELQSFAAGDVTPAGSETRYVRGQNFVLAYTSAKAGDPITHQGDYEYVVIVPHEDGGVRLDHRPTDDQGTATDAELLGSGIAVVPPGSSTVTAVRDGDFVRVFDIRTADLIDRCHNKADYQQPHPRVTPLQPWPEPVDGERLRVYRNADHPIQPGRFGRIFRTSGIMVNFGDPKDGPRNPDRMSPHHHDDFEQCSLTVAGDYVHHVRTPWTAKLSQWRADEHAQVASPAVAIIPPPTEHTSQAIGDGQHQLIDIFSPPRADFSERPGWVLNAEEYPAPGTEGDRG